MDYRTARRVLEVGASATYTDIKRAFRTKAKEVHPDQYKGKRWRAEARFAALVEAYRFLMNYRSDFQKYRYKRRSRYRFAMVKVGNDVRLEQ